MKKIIFLLSFAFLAYAVERPTFSDFLACYERNKASELTYEGLPAFVLDENLLAVVKLANSKLNSYVKYDPFLNLYLVRTDFSLIKPEFADENEKNRNDWLGILDAKKEYIGHLKYLALDLNERDKLDFKSKIGLLSSPCCKILGIALNNGNFIGNRYLKHFKKYNEVYWGDIGATFTQKGDRFFVSAVTFNTNFHINDEILSVDDKAVTSLRALNERVLFAPNQSTIYFKILRDNEEINLSVLVHPKIYKQEVLKTVNQVNKTQVYDSLGIILNDNLKVIKSNNANFKIGDIILRVNNILVSNKEHFAKLSTMNKHLNILISRHIQDEDKMGDFQFFITINKD